MTSRRVALVRLVDYSSVVHAVADAGERYPLTFCGRDAEGFVQGEGNEDDVTCRSCVRAMQPVRDMAKLNRLPY